MLHSFLEEFIGENIENYRIINYNKDNDYVLFHHNLISPKMPLFMCKIQNELVVPREKCKDNPYVKELLQTFSNNVLKVNYRMYYDYDLEYKIDRESFIKSIEILTKNNENYGTLLEIVRLTYNSQNKLMAYDYQTNTYKLFNNVYPNIDIDEIETYLDNYDMIDEDENARFYLDLNSFHICAISEEDYSDDEVIALDDTIWEVYNMSDENDIEELDLFIYFRSMYNIPNENNNIDDNSSHSINDENIKDINWSILVDNSLTNFMLNNEDMSSNILIIDNRTNEILGKNSTIVEYSLEDIGFKDEQAFFVNENYDEDTRQYEEIKEIINKHSIDVLLYHKLLTMEDDCSYKKNYSKSNIYDILKRINNNKNYSVYFDVMKYYFEEDEKVLYIHLNQDKEYNSYDYSDMLYNCYDVDEINCFSEKYLLANKNKLEEIVEKSLKKKGISSYNEYGTILVNPFTKKAYLLVLDYDENYSLLSIDEDLKDTILYPLINRILKLNENIRYMENDEIIKIFNTNESGVFFETNEKEPNIDMIPFISLSTPKDYYMETNNSIHKNHDDEYIEQHKRKHSLIEDDEIIFGHNSNLGENKSTTRNIEKKINIYDYYNQEDEPKNFIDKIKKIFSK